MSFRRRKPKTLCSGGRIGFAGPKSREIRLSERRHWSEVLEALKTPVSWVLLGLGFSAGLPFLLVGATLGMWLRQSGASLTLIGVFSGISLWYGAKVLWAPFMDKMRLPLLHPWLGQRRSYMLLSQLLIAAGLALMAWVGPKANISGFLAAGLLVAFAAASQEIAVDAWRVEETTSVATQALNPSLYSFGYRLGNLATSSLALILADLMGWAGSYTVMAGCMIVGIAATLAAPRTAAERHERPMQTVKQLLIDPFLAFVRAHAGAATAILLFVALYRLPDYVLGPVVGPMYTDTGLSNTAVAALRGSEGLIASFAGVALGGACLLGLGLERTLWLGAAATIASKLGFAWMSLAHGSLPVFAVVLAGDDLSNGVAETAMIAFMTRMTGRDFTLTHYALMYSVMAFTGKVLKMFSGQVIDALTPHLGLFAAYATFFAGCAVVGAPALALLWSLRRKGVFAAA
jgi:PAT family beta-lactamase induction signal transducer AmpG